MLCSVEYPQCVYNSEINSESEMHMLPQDTSCAAFTGAEVNVLYLLPMFSYGVIE